MHGVTLLSTRPIPPRERLIAALDVPTASDALRLVATLGDSVGFYKLGLELMTSSAYFSLVEELADAGKKLFLDLKLHDIPETVARAVRNLRERRAQFLTVHYDARVLAAAIAEKGELGILAVTLLTSIGPDDLRDLGFATDVAPADLVIARARRALELGCEGVVASPLEAERIRAAVGPKLAIVTPGIRPALAKPSGSSGGRDDQRRVATPRVAFEAGADYIVVGRPIRDAADPRGAALSIQETITSLFA
jgi:orotidine-5'-phosphate decarboxylase